MKQCLAFKEQSQKEILEMLQANANDTGQENFVRPYTPKVLAETEQKLMSGLKEMKKLQNKLAKIKKDYAGKIKPLKENNDNLLTNVELKGEMVLEEVFYFVDHDERKVGTYDANGNLVSERPARADELHMSANVFQMPNTPEERFVNPNQFTEPAARTGTDEGMPSFGIDLDGDGAF